MAKQKRPKILLFTISTLLLALAAPGCWMQGGWPDYTPKKKDDKPASPASPTLFSPNFSGRDGTGAPRPVPALKLQYGDVSSSYSVGKQLQIAAPVVTPTAAANGLAFTISPDLPEKVFINPDTGEISGIPQDVSSSLTYTVTVLNATNQTGTAQISFAITTEETGALTYALDSLVYVPGAEADIVRPQGSSPEASFSVEPALPSGLQLEPKNGAISGTPQAEYAEKEHVFKIATLDGTREEHIRIAVAAVQDVRMSDNRICAVLTDGSVSCWGTDHRDQRDNKPHRMKALRRLRQLTLGFQHLCATLESGKVVCAGSNSHHQLGTDREDRAANGVSSPAGGPLTGITQLVSGDTHSCALTKNSEVICWGSNIDGESTGKIPNDPHARARAQHTAPTKVEGLGGAVIQLAAVDHHTCALLTDGSVKCWGLDLSGAKIGVTLKTGFEKPVKQLAMSVGHACALVNDGSVRCWGSNDFGQLGDGTASRTLAPVIVSGLPGPATQVVVGTGFSCALLENAKVYCWGHNNRGQLGNGSLSVKNSIPTPVAGISEVSRIAASGNTACAISGGRVHCWGSSNKGQLGVGDAGRTYSPTPMTVGPWR